MMRNLNISFFSKRMLLGALTLLTSIGIAQANPTPELSEANTVASPQQAKITITGVVADANAESIIGANVVEKGTTNGTITNFDGEFSLNVAPGATLVISYIGYVEQEIRLDGKTAVTVRMIEDSQALEEVVVVGYGKQKKVNLTGSVSSVDFTEQSMSRPITNVSSALAGLSAGVQVMQTSGQPGSDGAKIRIRGVGTLNNADPLVLIDGIEGVMDAVNPLDIESISILKDAASGAIYGSRAANGVILITTKRGKAGSLAINYSGRVAFQSPTNLIDQMTNYADYMELINEAHTNIGQSNHFAQSTIDLWREKSLRPNELNEHGVPNYIAYPNTDWQDALFGHNGVLNNHTLSLSGGSEKIRFLTSVSYLDNPGLVDNVGIKTYSIRANIEADVTPWLTLGTRTFASQEDKDPGEFTNANNYLRSATPGVYPEWNGRYGFAEASEESATANNVTAMLNSVDGTRRKTRFNTTMFSRIQFMKGLSWDFNFNYSRRIDEEKQWTKAQEKVKFSDGTIMSPSTDPSEMQTYFYNYGNYQYTLQNLLNYNITIANDHDIAALAGYEETYYYQSTNFATKKGLIDESVNTPGSATEMQSVGGTATDRASRSFFGRINYAYKSRYLFEANLRRDGHSRYDRDYRWGTFPSFSAAWRISEEAFMDKTRHWLDNLKLRASYGELGNNGGDDVGNYEYQSTYGITRYSIGGTLMAGLSSTSIANSLLSWESSAVTNIGVDATMLNNRLTAEVEVYNKNTTGILYTPSISLTAGDKTAPRLNIAEMTNKGLEVTVGWKDRVKDFSYSVSANFAYNSSKIDKYKGALKEGWTTDGNGKSVWATNFGDVSSSTSAINPVVEGKMLKEFYLKSVYKGSGRGYAADGINGGPKDGMIRTEQDMEWLQSMIAAGHSFMPNQTIAKNKIWYGDYVFADANGDGIYGSTTDREFQGTSSTPKYNFGLQLSAAYKGFDISMNWAGAAGFKLYWGATTGYNSPTARVGLALPVEIANNHYFYDPENPSDPRTKLNAKYGRLVVSESGYQNTEASSLYLYDGDYLKLKNLTIGYTLPANVSKKLLTQNLRVYLSGENLFNFNSFPGQDPELGATPIYSTIKQIAIGANITF